MFDFIRKPVLWNAWNKGLDKEIGKRNVIHLKSYQDIIVYSHLKGLSSKTIAEIGGGNSQLLSNLSKYNECYNIEKFEGADGGPTSEIFVPGVQNIKVFLGEFSDQIRENSFDVVFSISVVEHVPNERLGAFLSDGLRILKSGGLWLHAIDLYVEEAPDAFQQSRFDAYREWLSDARLSPLGEVYPGPMQFTCDVASNPDDVMYLWGKSVPSLTPLRQRAQSVSLILAAYKR